MVARISKFSVLKSIPVKTSVDRDVAKPARAQFQQLFRKVRPNNSLSFNSVLGVGI